MQIVRTIVILFGLAVVAVGLYLFVLGVGAPIEINSIEVGALKASATGTFVGLLVAGVGLAAVFLAAQYMKRREDTEIVEEELDEKGQPTKRIFRISSVIAHVPGLRWDRGGDKWM
jgi:formate hydrogenlyase subunit 3/multisubunit Na+/H+ antiporter MnhD subunit